jgi:hypothetical protein
MTKKENLVPGPNYLLLFLLFLVTFHATETNCQSIDVTCPQKLTENIAFICNITMSAAPPAGFTSHNVTVTINTTLANTTRATQVTNRIFNTNTKVITAFTASKSNDFSITVYESNYNVSKSLVFIGPHLASNFVKFKCLVSKFNFKFVIV